MSVIPPAAFEYEIGACLRRQDTVGAGALAAQCRKAWPQAASGWLFGSIVALLAGDGQAALATIEEWLGTRPADSQCLLQKAECLLALSRREEALGAASEAATAADAPAAWAAVGQFFAQSGEYQQALECYECAVRASPADSGLRMKRAVIHRIVGNLELAAADYEAVLEISPSEPDALKGLAELRRQTPERNRIAAMEAALGSAPPESKARASLHFALAKSYADLDEYVLSWRHLTEGNRLERARFEYDPAEDRAIIDHLIAGFPQPESPAVDTTGIAPIFIVGLPRSGTTLVERIIGQHSQVHPAGELPALSAAISIATRRVESFAPARWSDLAVVLPKLEAAAIALEYLASAGSRRGGKPRFTDKQPNNFLYCALILRAFPRAKIVHLTRHPLASCYALYKTRFGGIHPYAYDLRELGDFYLGYRRLMAHWHRILPGRIHDVAYEDVVSALEPTTRGLLEYLDLPFEARCLDFHSNPAPIATASAVQARLPLYDSSVHQWKHYAEWLAPLRAQLAAGGIRIDQSSPALSAPA